jgi:hypothetical protein
MTLRLEMASVTATVQGKVTTNSLHRRSSGSM